MIYSLNPSACLSSNFNSKSNLSHQEKSFHGADKLLNTIQLNFGHAIKPLMISYFEKIDEILSQIANKTESKQKQNFYNDSLQSIKIHKFNVLTSFFNSIKQSFILFEQKDFSYFEEKIIKVKKVDNATTSSFDKNDVNEKLTQNALIHSFDISYKKQLDSFKQRFAVLISANIELIFQILIYQIH